MFDTDIHKKKHKNRKSIAVHKRTNKSALLGHLPTSRNTPGAHHLLNTVDGTVSIQCIFWIVKKVLPCQPELYQSTEHDSDKAVDWTRFNTQTLEPIRVCNTATRVLILMLSVWGLVFLQYRKQASSFRTVHHHLSNNKFQHVAGLLGLLLPWQMVDFQCYVMARPAFFNFSPQRNP